MCRRRPWSDARQHGTRPDAPQRKNKERLAPAASQQCSAWPVGPAQREPWPPTEGSSCSLAERLLPSGGPRSARRPRARVSHLLAGLLEAQNDDPNLDTPADGGERKRRLSAGRQAVGGAVQAAAVAAAAAAACAAVSGQKTATSASAPREAASAPVAEACGAASPPAKRRRGAAAAVAAVVLAEASSDSDEDAEFRAGGAAAQPPVPQAGTQRQQSQQRQQHRSQQQQQLQRKRRTRVLVDVHRGLAPGATRAGSLPESDSVENEYERQV